MDPGSPRRAFSVSVFARHASVEKGRRVLLIHHRRLKKWLPVGGEIEPGETPLEAAKRELLEETGLTGVFAPITGAIDGSPDGLLGYEEHLAGSKGLHMNFAFVADVSSDKARPNDEIVELEWIDEMARRDRSRDGLDCPLNVKQLLHKCFETEASPHFLEEVARSWLAAFNARDLDALLALYWDDAVHVSPKLREKRPETLGEIRGKTALRDWWLDAMTRLPNLHYRERCLTASGDRVFMEYDRLCDPDPVLHVAEVLVIRDGRISRSHVFHG